jgi:phage terminase large subunit-like protein
MLEIEDIKPDHKQRICAADFSINKANSALFLGYNETMQVQEDVFKNRYFDKDYSAATDAAQRVVIDTMLVWTPDKKRKIAIDYHNAREMIKVILEKFNIVKFICDNYQLEWLAAMFEEAGVEVEKFAFTTPVQWEFYTQFKTGLAAETVRYINHPLFMEEAKRVQRSSEKNNKIIPGNGFTKDLIDVGTMIYHAGIDRTFVETTTDYSIDTLNDAKLLEMVNNYAKCYNEAIRGHMGDVKGYIQSKMLLSDRQYEMLEEAVADLMPT